jgi:hypothetical protein
MKKGDYATYVGTKNIQVRLLPLQAPVVSLPIKLKNGLTTTAHIVRHQRTKVKAHVVVFDTPTVLLDWCLENNINDAIIGGFDLYHGHDLLGEFWVRGRQIASIPFLAPWYKVRGTAVMDQEGRLAIGARHQFPATPSCDLIQVGPVLVKDGISLMKAGVSPEGFSESESQFTPDPSIGRHPRAAIGYNDSHIWTVACDGRTEGDAGMNWVELADLLVTLGASEALNLDGGASTQMVRRGRLLNNPRGQFGDTYVEGYPITSAIYFEKR